MSRIAIGLAVLLVLIETASVKAGDGPFGGGGVSVGRVDVGGVLRNVDPTNPNSAVREGLRNGDPTNPNSAVREGARRIDPTTAARRELDQARNQAMGQLRKLNKEEILDRVRNALDQNINDQLNRVGASYDERTGEIDLRRTRMGESLSRWLDRFAQGNKKDSEVREFSYNVRSQRLSVRLYVRHCQSWGRSIDLIGPQNLYEVRQNAEFFYDFRSKSGGFNISFGGAWPNYSSKTFEKLSEGDLVSAAEAVVPRKIGEAAGVERENLYDEVYREYQNRYGSQNVYFSSRRFVNWASPDNLRRYAVSGIATWGASVSATMNKVRSESIKEFSELSPWLQRKGIDLALSQDMATSLLTGQNPNWPYIKFELVPVRYSAREKRLGTPWRHEDHLGFVVIWDNSRPPDRNGGSGGGGVSNGNNGPIAGRGPGAGDVRPGGGPGFPAGGPGGGRSQPSTKQRVDAAAYRIEQLAGYYAQFMEGQQHLPEAREVLFEARRLTDAAARVKDARSAPQAIGSIDQVAMNWGQLRSRLERLGAINGTQARKLSPIGDLIREMRGAF